MFVFLLVHINNVLISFLPLIKLYIFRAGCVCVCVFKLEHLVEILLKTGVLSKYLSFVSLPKLLLEREPACIWVFL